MKPNQEYLDSIAKKLDAFNQLNGVIPQQRQFMTGGLDIMNTMGQAALSHLEKKSRQKENPIAPDPLFRDHN